MAAGNAVIDLAVDPVSERRRRRRAFIRIGLPIAGVALMIVLIFSIAIYTSRANQRDVLALSDDLLATLDDRITLAVSTYLDPAVRIVSIARDLFQSAAIDDRRALAVSYGSIVLNGVPQIEDLLFADTNGNYLMVRRGAGTTIDVKLIRTGPGPRTVTWFHYDSAGKLIGQDEDPGDAYDPRTRPWYTGTASTGDIYWTGAYIFFTDKKPGVTASLRFIGRDNHPYVFAADIGLDVISKFLSGLEIGRTGRAFIIDSDGRLVASPSGSVMIKQGAGEPVAAKLDELNDPVLTRAYDQFRLEGRGRHIIEVDKDRYITAVTPLTNAGRDWSVLIVVPEKDFIGFVNSNNRNALTLSLSVVGIAALLAIFLIRQGLRADRNARLLQDRQRSLDRQSAAFATLAADASVFDPGHGEPPRNLTETLAEVTAARRVGLWRLSSGGRILHCEDTFDRATAGHSDGHELHRDELPQFFAALAKGEVIEAPDAARDPRTAEMYRLILAPVGARSLLAVPVLREKIVVGVLCLEDAAGAAAAGDFILAVANMVAARMALEADIALPAELPAARATLERLSSSVRSFTAALHVQGTDPATLEADIYTDVAVMVLQFTDPVAMAVRRTGGGRGLSDEIIRALQEVAHANDIPYLKIMSHEIVAAAGFDAAESVAAARIADCAAAIRERCHALFEEAGRPPSFRIGIDCGDAIGGTVGAGPRLFNLWGEAVHAATAMAASAPAGTVQASEAAYHKLRQDFLFRPRGRFYLPRSGEAQTFVLGSRL